MFRSGASQMKWSRPPPSETASLPVSSHSGSGQVTDHTSPTQPPTEQQQQQHCQHPVRWHPSAGLPFNQATRHFLSHQHLTDLWLPHSSFSCHRPSPEDLVGIAAQACQELSVPSGSPARARFSTFTDRLRSSKGSFLCAEAHPDFGGSLLVLAISDSLLTWDDYSKALPATAPTDDNTDTASSNYCVHPAVFAATQKVPIPQLAWLMSDTGCRVIICGKGTAGAIAQAATLQLQQLVRSQSTSQGSYSNSDEACNECNKILCVTFGAPPSLRPAAVVQGLIWNFLLAKKEVQTELQCESTYLWDIVPAVMGTVPVSPDSSISWLEAVQDVIAVQDSSRGSASWDQFQEKLNAAVAKLLAAGRAVAPSYMGPVWLLHEPVAYAPTDGLLMPASLSAYLDISLLDKKVVNRSQMKDYWDISSQAFPSVSRHADAHSAGMLESLRLSADIKGFFKPLTATAKTASGSLAVLNPMVGCQVTLEGIGVQWASAQAPQLELSGPGYDLLPFELETAQPSRIKVQSGMVEAQAGMAWSGAGTPSSMGNVTNTEAGSSFTASSPLYRATMHGALPVVARCRSAPEPGSSLVKACLHLQTHFGSQRIQLEVEASERETRDTKSRLTSGPVANQLQRAVVWAFSCLNSASDETKQQGLEILDGIDDLEKWCRVIPQGLPEKYAAQVRQTAAHSDWPAEDKTIKKLVIASSKASQGLGSLAAFGELDTVSPDLNKIYQSVTAVLASPLLLQYDTLWQERASAWVLLGLSVMASAALPAAIPAITVAAGTLRTAAAAYFDGSPLSWTWWGMQKVYQVAYEKKLEELLDMLVPGGRHQQDVTMLEDCLVEACDRARGAHSKLGRLLDGPPVNSGGQEQPSHLPVLWTHDQLQTEKLAWPLPNQRYLTTSCMQVLSVHLNRIRSLHTLRNMIRDCCLVGFVGEINSGKTTMTRLLQGLEPEEEGQTAQNATRCIAGDQLKLCTAAGLEATAQSPIIIDTPGMFDPEKKLNDAARYQGSMALYVIVVSAQAVGRNQFDANLASSIVEIVNLGRPVLICINMMCEKMHWWKTADATAKACTAIKDSIVSKADRDHGPVTVFMTECLFYDDFQEQMQARQIKTVEDVREWICQTAQGCEFDVPTATYDAHDFEVILSPQRPGASC